MVCRDSIIDRDDVSFLLIPPDHHTLNNKSIYRGYLQTLQDIISLCKSAVADGI